MTIKIENIGGIILINGKRLGHDSLTETEKIVLNQYIKESKTNGLYNTKATIREIYTRS